MNKVSAAGTKRMTVMLSAVMVMQLLATSLTTDKVQAAEASADLKLDATAAILMDASSGQVLYEMNADTVFPPASMSKMMTEYIVMEQIESGKLKWDDIVTTSQYASEVIGSGQLLALNEKLPVKDMFAAMSIYSANDASVALAEQVSGSEEDFANLMNETARKLGLSEKAHFINATGLSRADLGKNAPKNIQGETVISAKDAALLAFNILKDHKEVLEFTKIPSVKLRASDKSPMINWNWMLEGNKDNINFKKYSYVGLDGLKTGHTNEAGYCFTGTAERNGMRLISVVMGTKSDPKRFEESRKLLDYGFNNFEVKKIFTAQTEIDSLKSVDVKKGKETQVGVVTKGDLSILVKKGAKDEQFVKTATPIEEGKRIAPIKQGDVLGKVTVTYDQKNYDVDLIAKEDVEKGGWFRLFFRGIKNFFGDMFNGIKNLF